MFLLARQGSDRSGTGSTVSFGRGLPSLASQDKKDGKWHRSSHGCARNEYCGRSYASVTGKSLCLLDFSYNTLMQSSKKGLLSGWIS